MSGSIKIYLCNEIFVPIPVEHKRNICFLLKLIQVHILNSTYHSVLTVLMKNCEPLVLGPVFAIDKVPARQRK